MARHTAKPLQMPPGRVRGSSVASCQGSVVRNRQDLSHFPEAFQCTIEPGLLKGCDATSVPSLAGLVLFRLWPPALPCRAFTSPPPRGLEPCRAPLFSSRSSCDTVSFSPCDPTVDGVRPCLSPPG